MRQGLKTKNMKGHHVASFFGYQPDTSTIEVVFPHLQTGLRRYAWVQGFLIIALLIAMSGPVFADAAISQEVFNDSDLPKGAVVSLTSDNPRSVELANSENSQYLLGIVSSSGSALAELGTADEGTQIATNGDVPVIVSTITGDIIAGDILVVSSIQGVASKVSTIGGTTLGVALTDFNAGSVGAKEVQATGEEGSQAITIGTIAVRLAINDYFVDQVATQNVLVSVGERLLGRPVSLLQTLVAAAIVMASLLVGGMAIYSSIRGSFVSIGRNPLAGSAIFNSLVYVTLINTAVVVIGVIVAYVVLLL